MKTFNRYFIHFFSVSVMALIVFIILLMIDGSALVSPIFLLVMFGCVLFFSIPMALLYTKMAILEILIIESSDVEADIAKINKIVMQKFKRENVYDDGWIKTYRSKKTYHAWLTNPITVEQREQRIYISIPKCYCEEIRQMFPTASVTMK